MINSININNSNQKHGNTYSQKELLTLKKTIPKLLYDVECAVSEMYIDDICELEPKIMKLFDIFPSNSDVLYMIELIKKAKEQISNWKRFDKTKSAMLEAYIDYDIDSNIAHEEADNFSWQEIFNQ